MRVLIAGYVPEEGRVSMMRTAHSIARHAAPLLDTDDEVALCDPRGLDHTHAAADSRRVKIEKRLLGPARLWLRGAEVIHLIDSDHAFGIAPWNFRRTIVTCHDLMPFLLDPTLETVFGGRLGRYCYRRAVRNLATCAHVACVSEFTRRQLLERTGCRESRTSVIPQGVEAHFKRLEPVNPALRAFRLRPGLSGKRILLHVGSCLPYKNIAGLLEILRRLVAGGRDDIALLKVGGNFSIAARDFIAAEGLDGALVHCTSLAEEELVLAYNAADLLLWPSHFEGFGLPVLEAMACGTPVVCSNGGALAEVAADKARVHAPEDVDGMAESCGRILDDPALAGAMGEAGIAHARSYTWERAARAYLALYKRVASGDLE